MNIIQIGTNRAFDNLTSIVHQYNLEDIDNLILVEPFSLHNDSIKSCYYNYISKLHIENIVISDKNLDNIKIWYHPDDLSHTNATELASLDINHAHKIRSHYSLDDMRYIECRSINLNSLFDKFNLKTIDILYIDTEGFDDKIIYSINFNKYIIKTIYYENLHIDKSKLRTFLIEHNYYIDTELPGDPYADRANLIL